MHGCCYSCLVYMSAEKLHHFLRPLAALFYYVIQSGHVNNVKKRDVRENWF